MMNDRVRELENEVQSLKNDLLKAVESLQRRNRELTVLNAITEALSSPLDTRGALEQALSYAIAAYGFAGGLIALADPDTHRLVLFTHIGLPSPLVERLQVNGMDNTLCDHIYRQQKPLVLEDLQHSEWEEAAWLLEMGLRAYVGMPILHHHAVTGSLCLFDIAPHPLSEPDLALLSAIGRQIGVSVENARLVGKLVHEREISRTLLSAAESLSATLRLDKLLEHALNELQRIVPYDTALISMVRGEWWWIVASRGRESFFPARFRLREFPLIQRIVQTKSPVCVPDVRQESAWVAGKGTPEIRSWLGAPLIARDTVFGILMVNSYYPLTYNNEAASLLAAFAHQVALAAENARLYEQVRLRLREANMLHSVTTALSSTLNISQLLPYVARSLGEILGATSVEIFTVNWETQTLVVATSYSDPDATPGEPFTQDDVNVCLKPGQMLALAETPTFAHALDLRRPLQVRLDDPDADPLLRIEVEARAAQALLFLPMLAGDRVLGFCLIWDSLSPRRFTEGEIATAQTVMHQAAITLDNAHLVEALRQQTIELQARNEELDAFAHTVAHDLKGPLGNLSGYTFLLEGDPTQLSPAEYQEYVHAISQGVQRMSNIIDELLLLASVRRLEEVDIRPLDMGEIVAEVQRRLVFTIKEYQAEIVFPETWPVASGYGPWIEEVWANYISNAMKYGGRPPRIELGATVQPDGMVRFWVRDNGPGVTAEERARLFKLFSRLDQVRAKGHGLGLSIVRRIVERLGGQVGVESIEGQGSVFSFTLPQACEPVE